jgi:hypothetical protein
LFASAARVILLSFVSTVRGRCSRRGGVPSQPGRWGTGRPQCRFISRGRQWALSGLQAPSRPEEFHPESLTDPDVNLSIHPARAIARRLPPSAEIAGSSRFDPVGPRSTAMTHPLRSMGITPLRRTCRLADYAEWFREDTVFSRICRWSNDRRPASIRHSLTSYKRSFGLKRTRLRRSYALSPVRAASLRARCACRYICVVSIDS